MINDGTGVFTEVIDSAIATSSSLRTSAVALGDLDGAQ